MTYTKPALISFLLIALQPLLLAGAQAQTGASYDQISQSLQKLIGKLGNQQLNQVPEKGSAELPQDKSLLVVDFDPAIIMPGVDGIQLDSTGSLLALFSNADKSFNGILAKNIFDIHFMHYLSKGIEGADVKALVQKLMAEQQADEFAFALDILNTTEDTYKSAQTQEAKTLALFKLAIKANLMQDNKGMKVYHGIDRKLVISNPVMKDAEYHTWIWLQIDGYPDLLQLDLFSKDEVTLLEHAMTISSQMRAAHH